MKKLHLVFIFASCFISAAIAENAGQWDSNIYNLMEHPKTIAIRIEVTDSDTGMPIRDAHVLFRGTYTIKGRNSRHPDGERNEERKDYELTIATDNKGIAIASFGWHKEYPWSEGNDDIEKAQNIQIRCQDYYQIEMGLFFERFLNVGQRPDSPTQEPAVFDKFEEAWHNECSRNDVRLCVFDLGTKFPDFGNKLSKRPEFFEKIYNRDWYKSYKEPQNWFSKGESPQSLCGPYFVYLVNIKMKKIRPNETAAVNSGVDSESLQSVPPQSHNTQKLDSKIIATDVEWQIGLFRGLSWGMRGEEVEKIVSGQGFVLNVATSYQDPSTRKIAHHATIEGEFSFGRSRITEVRMGFIDKRLTFVHFVNVSEPDSDNFYNECVQLFGPGIENTWDDKDVRGKIENPKLCRTCKRYFSTTLIESKVGYTWSSDDKRHVRYASVTMQDWNATGKASDEYSKLEADQYRKLIQSIKSGKKVNCEACNGTGKCKICSGAGKKYDYKFYPCPYPACGGKGWYEVRNSGGERKACNTCKGTGQIKSYREEEIPCTRCKGIGKCIECNGGGEIQK
jgi:hypothetical protein